MAKSTSGTIVKVLNLGNSKPPQFNRKKGDNYIIWKMKFEADQVMKRLNKEFQPNFEQENHCKKKKDKTWSTASCHDCSNQRI